MFNHGSPLTLAEQQKMTPFDYPLAVRFFAERGYVVVTALRRGFGESEGRFSEGVLRDRPDYVGAGRAAADDIRGVLSFLKTMPGLDLGRVVLAGHSAGGFGSLALLGQAGVHVRGAISFAGGKGSQWLGDGPLYTRGLVAAVTEYGREAHAPSLWIYSDNDHFFPPFIATQMFRAYTDAGAPANLERLPAIGTDGHNLFTANAEKLWAPAVDRFLLGLGLPSGKASVLED